MSEPILIHLDGHTYPTHMPVDFANDDIKAWIQALEHVAQYVAPHGLSFVLHGRGGRVYFRDGIPAKNDVNRLCQHLRAYQDKRARVASSLPAAA